MGLKRSSTIKDSTVVAADADAAVVMDSVVVVVVGNFEVVDEAVEVEVVVADVEANKVRVLVTVRALLLLTLSSRLLLSRALRGKLRTNGSCLELDQEST